MSHLEAVSHVHAGSGSLCGVWREVLGGVLWAVYCPSSCPTEEAPGLMNGHASDLD